MSSITALARITTKSFVSLSIFIPNAKSSRIPEPYVLVGMGFPPTEFAERHDRDDKVRYGTIKSSVLNFTPGTLTAKYWSSEL